MMEAEQLVGRGVRVVEKVRKADRGFCLDVQIAKTKCFAPQRSSLREQEHARVEDARLHWHCQMTQIPNRTNTLTSIKNLYCKQKTRDRFRKSHA